MTPRRLVCLLLLCSAFTAAQPTIAALRINEAFEKFWDAKSPKEAAKLTDEIVKTGVTFDEALRRLKAGRTYAAQKSGVAQFTNQTRDGIEHYYAVNVPANYDPARRYQMRFQLHGGVGGRLDNKPRGNGEIGALAGAEQFYVLPYAWDGEPWWSDDQVLNLGAIVDAMKRTYNIDENRVVVSGVSDGATGAYYIAMRLTTPFASFLPLNGFIMVLANDGIDDHRIFPSNLRNKPLFVVNGGKDRLYPTWAVEPYTKHLLGAGVQIEYHPQPEGEHNTRWWPEVKGPYEDFVAAHPRDPDPDQLSWQAGPTDGNDAPNNRAHWLIVDKFGVTPPLPRPLADLNAVKPDEFPLYDQSDNGVLFDIDKSSGRVDLARAGNTIRASVEGVTQFTLLLSPDKFDFKQPVKVSVNGREVFNAKVAPSVKTLLKWAAQDNDRTMLYAVEAQIRLGDQPPAK